MNNLVAEIANSDSFTLLQQRNLLPEPYADNGYYFIYYSEKDYRKALSDIVLLADAGLRIWYDRKLESGKSWEADMLSRAENFHCSCVVFYLSANCFESPFFWQLCELVIDRKLAYCSVNLPDEKGLICSGEELSSVSGLSDGQISIINKLFNKDVTYISGSLNLAEKLKALESTRKNDKLVYKFSGNTATVLCVKDLAEERIVIPGKLENNGEEYTVKYIAPFAFADCTRLKEIYFPDSIEFIGTDSSDIKQYEKTGRCDFLSHSKMMSGGLGDGGVFKNCRSLEEITLPPNLKVLHTNLFVGCVSLKKLIIGDKITQISGQSSFAILDASYASLDFLNGAEPQMPLHELKLPSIFKKIKLEEGEMFAYYDESVGWTDFDCDGVENVYGYEELEIGSEYICKENERLGCLLNYSPAVKFVDMRKSADDELYDSFSYCFYLEKVILPPNLKKLCGTFEGCIKLEEVDLPESLTSIEGKAFSNCGSLKQIRIPAHVHTVDQDVFEECSSLETIISDSYANKKLFTPENSFKKILNNVEFSTAKKIIRLILLPIFAFFSFIQMMFTSSLRWIGIVCFLTFPVSVWVMLLRGSGTFLDEVNAKTIYLKKRKRRQFGIRKYRKVKSDMDGYFKYELKKSA